MTSARQASSFLFEEAEEREDASSPSRGDTGTELLKIKGQCIPDAKDVRLARCYSYAVYDNLDFY